MIWFLGIKFEKVQSNDNQYFLHYKVRGSKVDYITGKIITNNSQVDNWIIREQSGFKKINKGKTDHPLKVFKKTVRVTKDKGSFIIFGHSNTKTDNAQTAVPFWDAQTVTPVPAVPLMGAGFLWRSIEESGGFIAPVVVPFITEEPLRVLKLNEISSMIENLTENWHKHLDFGLKYK